MFLIDYFLSIIILQNPYNLHQHKKGIFFIEFMRFGH